MALLRTSGALARGEYILGCSGDFFCELLFGLRVQIGEARRVMAFAGLTGAAVEPLDNEVGAQLFCLAVLVGPGGLEERVTARAFEQ